MLSLDIEYLTGVSFAASAQSLDEAEWPPHPDRLFSALLATWAESGKDAEERTVLEWLERQPPPVIHACPAENRDVVGVFVPPNDMTCKLNTVPQLRKNRQPRNFPASIPHPPEDDQYWHIRFSWPDAPETEQVKALARLAGKLAYLGHSASLVRAYVSTSPVPAGLDTYQPEDTGTEILRWVYPGRLAEMVEDFEWSRQYNLARKKSQQEHVFRPLPGPAVRYSKNGHVKPPTPATPFGTDWIVFADEGGNLPELTAFCHVAKTMRDALLGAADNPIPEVLSGHRPDRSPAAAPHIAVIPLGNVGWQHSDGRLVGVGLVIPRNLEQEENRHQPDRLSILRAVGRLEGTPGSPVELTLGKLGVWRLGRRPTPDRSSLEPGRYTRCARRWSSVTSVVLDLFPKDKDGQRVEDVIAKACENIGLPRPAVIWTHKHPAIAGAPSAWPAGGNPPSMDWSFPKGSPLTQKPRIHVTLEFEQEVSGPVILGAGRFQGMGLCLPIDEKKGDHRA